jgi:hypothetical protein
MIRGILAVIVGAWVTAGCVPVHSEVRKNRSGRVTDAVSGKPVVGATIRAESFRVPTPPGYGGRGTLIAGVEVTTDRNGQWELPSDSKWTVGILAPDGMPLFVEVHCVLAEGYEAAIRNPHKAWLGLEPVTGPKDATDHEIETEVRLEPSPRSSADATPKDHTRCGVPM